ncbi:hypothetical protein MRB53_037284 [Persea americana]|nr:hypothetical protein MRB53_037284 [Persea americana]
MISVLGSVTDHVRSSSHAPSAPQITKGGKGGFKDTMGADILTAVFGHLIEKSKIDPKLVEDIAVGCVLAPGGGATEFRAAALAAGFPETAAVKALNRQCSSGLMACVDIANAHQDRHDRCRRRRRRREHEHAIRPPSSHRVLRPSRIPRGGGKLPRPHGHALRRHGAGPRRDARRAGTPLPQSRTPRPSRRRSLASSTREIVPIKVKWTDPKTDEEKEITVARDDGVREGHDGRVAGKLRPAFGANGTIHAGNASQVSDGAAAVLLMKRSTAERLGQPILGKFVQASIVGVKPLLMGVGPLGPPSPSRWRRRASARTTSTSTRSTRPLPASASGASMSSRSPRRRSTPRAAPSPLATRWDALARDRSARCSRSSRGRGRRLALLREWPCPFLHLLPPPPPPFSTLFRHIMSCVSICEVMLTRILSMCVGTGMGMAAVWVAE